MSPYIRYMYRTGLVLGLIWYRRGGGTVPLGTGFQVCLVFKRTGIMFDRIMDSIFTFLVLCKSALKLHWD